MIKEKRKHKKMKEIREKEKEMKENRRNIEIKKEM